MSIPDRMSFEDAVARYRDQFGNGPIGKWYYDNDINMGYGGSILFRADGTGVSYFWDDEGDVEEPFCWELVGEQQIAIRPHPDTPADSAACEVLWRTIHYDFEVRVGDQNVHGIYLLEKGCSQLDRSGAFGFWESPDALLRAEDATLLNNDS